MKSSVAGKNISIVEIQNISVHGIWIFVLDNEYFIPYTECPWFKEAKVIDICNVELLHNKYLYWPTLDIDLSLKILENFDHYPLKVR